MKCTECKNKIKVKDHRISFLATKPYCKRCYALTKPNRNKGSLEKYWREFILK